MLKFNDFINESKNGYWVFEPKKGFSRPTIRYPYPRYTKEEAIDIIGKEHNFEQYKEPYYEEKTYPNTISFKDDVSHSPFVNWLRKNKGYEGYEEDLKSYYSSWELDYLYDEFEKNN